ncbi:MAG: DNA adenine methylase [Legionella sp.]
MAFYTPLRYPGGKGKLSYYVKAIIEKNELFDEHYLEPFAGGAGVALELLIQEYVRKIHINDIDPAIYSFWHAVLNTTDELCRLINDTPVNMDSWLKQKTLLSKTGNHSNLEIGFATFFLNRTNRSGILKAGVIGGKNQSGKWKIDVRYQKEDLIKRIKLISNYASRIYLTNKDATEFIKSIPDGAKKSSLVYLDPPYYTKGQDLYRNFYNHSDHVEVMKSLTNSGFENWIVSYDNTHEIRNIYKDFRMIEYSLQYTAQNKKIGEEVMFFSNNLSIPDIKK